MSHTSNIEASSPVKLCSMEGFFQYLINSNRIPQSRAKMYVNMVRKFHNHVGKPYVDIKQCDVRGYLSSLKKHEHLKDRSIYVHLVAIKKFYQFLWNRGEVDKIPSDGLRIKYWKKKAPPKIEKRRPKSGSNH